MKKFSIGMFGVALLLTACTTLTPGGGDGDGDADDGAGTSLSAESSSGPFLDQGDAGLSSEPTAVFDLGDGEDAAVRVVQISAVKWAFTPATVTVKKGEKVRLEVTNADGKHGVSVPGLGIEVRPAEGQNTFTVDVPTDKAGTFEGFCNIPCGEGHKDMKMTIVIEE